MKFRSKSNEADSSGHGLATLSTPRSGTQMAMLNLADNNRNNLVAVLGEFVGTFLFLFWSFVGTQISNTPVPPDGSPPNTSALLFAALAFGFSLTVNVWAFFRITGGLFNPSVTLALFLVGGLPVIRSLLVFLAQIAGGLCAAAVVSCLFPGPLSVATTLGGGTSTSQGLFIEMFLTAQLVFVIIMLAVVKHKSTFLAPVGIGLTFFLCELCGIYFTGGSLNFARSLGPAAVNHHFPHYFWIYFVGPLLGSLLASGFFKLINSLRYETCNPGQDFNEMEAQNGKSRLLSEDNGQPTSSAPASNHQRNFSEATAVHHDYHGNNNAPPQGDISAINPSANMQPVHEKVERV